MQAVSTAHDSEHLRRALDLAEGGRGRVSPNPMVGAVIVAPDGRIIGEGFHAELGGPHAERAAIADAHERGQRTEGATIYVTLEPCAHHGRQPPCTEAILEAGIARCVYASDDPTEKAAGRGPGILRDGGVEVEAANGPEAAEARLLNQAFRKLARTGRPLVTYKAALSLDGRTATTEGDSKWISGERSRELVHRWRAESDAIAAGIGTVLADDPLLTARPGPPTPAPGIGQPTRVIFDTGARLPLGSQLVATAPDPPVLVVAGSEADPGRAEELRGAGAEVISVPGDEPARLDAALAELGRRDISTLFVEGGATLAGAMLRAGCLDELRFFIAPVVLGDGPGPFAGGGAGSVSDAIRPLSVTNEAIGEDVLVTARLREY